MRIIREVRLENFRCHDKYWLKLDDGVTQILGENGCGKTSVLEAIYLGLRGKSFRAVDSEIRKKGEEFYRVEILREDGTEVKVIFNEKRTFLISDQKKARLPKDERYPVVLFLPEDLHLVASSPSRKRRFFDNIIGQSDFRYGGWISRYEKALRQRNELLKNTSVSEGDLFAWNVLLAKNGVAIRKARTEIVNEINSLLTETYRSIAENEDEVRIIYDSFTAEANESEYLRCLELDMERDSLTGHTNFGVHRDSFQFVFNGAEADGNASRGETRSIIVALKFIEARLLREKLGVEPIVLLDDVFSELDEARREALVKNFRENQVVLTSVE